MLQTLDFTAVNRGNRIWTCDLTAPSRARYQATPYPANELYFTKSQTKNQPLFQKNLQQFQSGLLY